MAHLLITHTIFGFLAQLGRLQARLNLGGDALVIELLEHAKHTMADVTPTQSGKAKAAWRVQMLGSGTGALLNDQLYVRYLFTGTAPHVIRARNAPVLTFYNGGTLISRTQINHPGTRPNDEMWSALYGEKAYAEMRAAAMGRQITVNAFPNIPAPSGWSGGGGP